MKKNIFDIKLKYDGVPIIDTSCKDIDEIEEELRIFKKKFGR
jgi:hypothetical protein